LLQIWQQLDQRSRLGVVSCVNRQWHQLSPTSLSSLSIIFTSPTSARQLTRWLHTHPQALLEHLSLNFKYMQISRLTARDLVEAICTSAATSQLASLHVTDASLLLTSDNSALPSLASLTSLTSLCLSSCGLCPNQLVPLTKLTRLKVLDVSHNNLRFLAEVLPFLGKGLQQLEVLNLSGSDVKVSELNLLQSFSKLQRVDCTVDIMSQYLAGVLHDIPEPLLPLTSVSLSIQLDSVKAYIQEAREHLEYVTLHGFRSPEDAAVIRALADVSHLRQLSLYSIDLNGLVGASVAALTQLKSLQFKSCVADVGMLQHIVSSLPGLTELELHLTKFLALGPVLGCGSDKQGSSTLPELTSLTIWDLLSGASCAARALPLLKRLPKLRTLTFHGLEGVVGAMHHLSALTSLVELTLGALPTAELVEALVPLSNLVALRLVGMGCYMLSDTLKLQLPVVGLHFTKLKQLQLLELPLDFPLLFCKTIIARVSLRFPYDVADYACTELI
jgi:Leucine-rich repeat (LRR) protein